MSTPRPRFARRPPGQALAPYVECYWWLTAEQAPPWKSRILPDGSNDVILDLSAEPRPFVVGVMRRAGVVPLAGHVDLLGVRFRPGGALPFLRVPLHELSDRHIPLDALWGPSAGSLADAVAAAPLTERLTVLEGMLLANRAPAASDDLIPRAVALMRRTRGGIGVRAAARALGVGERRLERAFDIAIGLSPKRFARVVRFLGAVRDIGRRSRGGTGAALACDAGYTDQPHFIREFKRLAGVTPAQYAAERRVGIVQDENSEPA